MSLSPHTPLPLSKIISSGEDFFKKAMRMAMGLRK